MSENKQLTEKQWQEEIEKKKKENMIKEEQPSQEQNDTPEITEQPTDEKIEESFDSDKEEDLPKIDLDDPLLYSELLFGDTTAVMDETEKKRGNWTTERIQEAIEKGDFHLLRAILVRSYLNENRDQTNHLIEELKALNKRVDDIKDTLKSSDIDKTSKGHSYKGQLHGASATRAMLASVRGFKKIRLFNSGIYVEVRPPTLSELNGYYNTVISHTKDMGYLIGSNYLSMMDVLLKKYMIDIIPNLVTDSNLHNWENGNTLIDNISIHDYDVLIWGICSIMYKNQTIPLPYRCLSDQCKYEKAELPIELDKLRFNDTSLLTKEMVEFTLNDYAKTPQQLLEYRQKIDKATNNVIKCEKLGLHYTMSVPTLSKFVSCGEDMISEVMARAAKSENDRDVRAWSEYMLEINRMIVPWIKEAKKFDDEGQESFTTDETEAIVQSLAIDLHDEDELFDSMKKFVHETKTTYLCYTALKCPKCGKEPEQESVEGFTPVDLQSLFFDLSCRRLKIID